MTPSWLAEFQARFGEVLRTPLERATGTLTARMEAYDPAMVAEARDRPGGSGAERLAVYNRQYWFRLFDVLQSAFPLSARLIGFWEFNGYAADWLRASPPTGWDLDRVPDGFDVFLDSALPSGATHRQALVEAVRLDAAWRAVFRAPHATAFRPGPDDASRLLTSSLVASPAVRMVEEHWPLIELRRQVVAKPEDRRVDFPAPLGQSRTWALIRRDEGILQVPLEPEEADLLRWCAESPIGEAVVRLEGACPEQDRAALPPRVERWLARSVELGLWSGVRE